LHHPFLPVDVPDLPSRLTCPLASVERIVDYSILI